MLSIILEMLHQIKNFETYTSEPHHSRKVQLCWHSPMIDLTAPAKNKTHMKLWNPKTRIWVSEMYPHVWDLQHWWWAPHLWPGLVGMPAWCLCLRSLLTPPWSWWRSSHCHDSSSSRSQHNWQHSGPGPSSDHLEAPHSSGLRLTWLEPGAVFISLSETCHL